MQIKIDQVIIDETIYPRSFIDPGTVERYREALESGAKLPPLVLMRDNRLLDGRHRLEAYRLLGVEAVEAEVEEPADPDVRAVELNLRHGRPLTRQELREAARRWYGKRPVVEIADLLGVSRRTVQNWVADLAAEREEVRADLREQALRMRAEGLSQEKVAEKLGISQQTISYWEKQEYQSEKNCSLWYENISNINKCEEQCGMEYASEKNCLLAYTKTSSSLAAEREEARAGVREQALRMRAEGLSQEEVAEKLGIPRQTISYWEKQGCQSVKNLTPLYAENSSIVTEREDADNSSYGDGGKKQEGRVKFQ